MTANWREDSMDGVHCNNSLPRNVSTHFERHSRVKRSSSYAHSPRRAGQRKTTTHLPARTRSVLEHQSSVISSVPQSLHGVHQARPMSWHPSFMSEYNNFQQPYQHVTDRPCLDTMNTVFAHGLVTPTPMPMADEPYLNFSSVPLDHLVGQNLAFDATTFHHSNPYQYNQNRSFDSYTPISAPEMESTDYQIQNLAWPPMPMTTVQDIVTAPTSPDFLPMPDLGPTFAAAHTSQDEDKDALVGLGLYDSPDQVRSANLLFSGSLPVRRKSLKLEESFEPADEGDENAEAGPVDEACTRAVRHESCPENATCDAIQQYYDQTMFYNQLPEHHLPVYDNVFSTQAYGWV